MEISYFILFYLVPVKGMVVQWPPFCLLTFRSRVRPVLTLDDLSVFSCENDHSDWFGRAYTSRLRQDDVTPFKACKISACQNFSVQNFSMSISSNSVHLQFFLNC